MEKISGRHYALVRDLIDVELQQATQVKRNKLMHNLETSLKRNFYEDEQDALAYTRKQQKQKLDTIEEWDRVSDEYIEPIEN